jgi:hypothetical protein
MLRVLRLLPALACVGLLAASCVSPPAIKPEAENSAALVFQVRVIPPGGAFFAQPPQQVFFARVQGTEILSRSGLLAANYISRGRFYLLNAPPGDYVLVGATRSNTQQGETTSSAVGGGTLSVTTPSVTSNFIFFLSESALRSTRVRVEAGKLTIAGQFDLTAVVAPEPSDRAHVHYRGILLPLLGGGAGIQVGTEYLCSGVQKSDDDATRNASLKGMAEELKGTAWSQLLP